ncbi:MAG TPA: hypothetical protein VMV39_02280, partial [Terracidiphilus sp.]|nr:hypothetical protein [Terracidiphilus sp.]
MNSGMPIAALHQAVGPRAPRSILVLTMLYVALLVAVGIMICFKYSGVFWPLSLCVAFVPAVLYATAAFVYGHALFGHAEPEQRIRAWRSLLWMPVPIYGVAFAIQILAFVIFERDEPLMTDKEFWGSCLIMTSILASLVLWAYIGVATFLPRPSSRATSIPVRKLGLSFLAGSVMVLSSLALDVNYSNSGWSTLTWQGAWVSNEFIVIGPLRPWLNGLTMAGYGAGILLALLTVLAGVMLLLRRTLPQKTGEALWTAGIVILWFTLTNYYCNCLYLIFVGIFNFWIKPRAEFAIITVVWLMLFALGISLWFKDRQRADDQGGTL